MEGGIVSKIHIKTGDLVSTNQPLITLSEVQSSSDYQTSRGEYLSNMGKLTRLEAEFSGVSSIDFPAYLKEEHLKLLLLRVNILLVEPINIILN